MLWHNTSAGWLEGLASMAEHAGRNPEHQVPSALLLLSTLVLFSSQSNTYAGLTKRHGNYLPEVALSVWNGLLYNTLSVIAGEQNYFEQQKKT